MDGGWDAIVLAGGAARRLGGADKPGLVVGGSTLLDRVLAAVSGAGTVVVVGPGRATARADVQWCREDPPGGGPVAALAAAVPRTAAGVVVVLAADLPSVAPAVPALLGALRAAPDAARSVLVDPAGRPNHLAAAWRRPALVAALAALDDPAGVPMRALADGAVTVPVADEDGWGRDCDTWADVAAARADAAQVTAAKVTAAQAARRSSPA